MPVRPQSYVEVAKERPTILAAFPQMAAANNGLHEVKDRKAKAFKILVRDLLAWVSVQRLKPHPEDNPLPGRPPRGG